MERNVGRDKQNSLYLVNFLNSFVCVKERRTSCSSKKGNVSTKMGGEEKLVQFGGTL